MDLTFDEEGYVRMELVPDASIDVDLGGVDEVPLLDETTWLRLLAVSLDDATLPEHSDALVPEAAAGDELGASPDEGPSGWKGTDPEDPQRSEGIEGAEDDVFGGWEGDESADPGDPEGPPSSGGPEDEGLDLL